MNGREFPLHPGFLYIQALLSAEESQMKQSLELARQKGKGKKTSRFSDFTHCVDLEQDLFDPQFSHV